ncbi:DUF1440 domain-containing protein [uncultured Pseudokineococcus sp.]|uniref:DUF1440 domain-containing protein n=1 Tax=uncultured Pseudokineococcus sp. TaxID=1642928 RepID=UPI0026132427|nr:DUF1440 domain-containing protein [uncultured Pseudokineococcus sp.]
MADLLRTLALGVVAGGAATYAKTRAEGALQPLAERALPPSPAAERRSGADPADHPDRMPPAELVDAALRRTTGEGAGEQQRTQGSQALHWGMGLGAGVLYTALSQRIPSVRAGLGAVFGLALYGATHASALPAAGLQAPLRELPRAALVWEPGSHVVYGVVLEAVLRLAGRDEAVDG